METITVVVPSNPFLVGATIATPILILIGALFACRQWMSTRNSRMADIVLTLLQRWESEEMQRSRRAVSQYSSGKNLLEAVKKADEERLDSLCDLVAVGNFFDGLGVLLKHGYLEITAAYDLFWRAEEFYYALYGGVIQVKTYENYLEGLTCLRDYLVAEAKKRPQEPAKKKRPI